MGESLRESVEAQARAHVRGDDAAFASYMTPRALLQLRGNGHVTPRRFEIIALSQGDGVGESAVRYAGRGSYVLRQRWEKREGVWKAIDAERPANEVRLSFWRRLFGGRVRDEVSPRDLT
ncbi:MAG: hypothetical protein WD359_05230 [Dehalococcoidia bacterium]